MIYVNTYHITKQTRDSSIANWIAMFDSASSLLRGIASILNNPCTEPSTTTNNVAEQETESSASVVWTKPYMYRLNPEIFIDIK